jgi:hypothetical protein
MMDSVNVRIIGDDDYWNLILAHDVLGAWSVDDIAEDSRVSKAVIRIFIERLVKGGYAQAVITALGKDTVRPLAFRLLKRPLCKPRLKADGSPLPETMLETMWRSMRMAKTFSAQSLSDFGNERETKVSLETARRYLSDLAKAGIVAPLEKSGKTFRLVRNLGSRAPRVLTAHIVFDPNSKTVIGDPVASEVQS